jgi:site-specific DNA recombinase
VLEPPRRRALIYTRISQDRTGAGLGVERQEADCRALADRLKCDVVKVFSDNDTSAYKGKRRGYEALLADLSAGIGDTLIAWHSDRLHRQLRELEDFIDLINERTIEVHFVQSGELDLATPAGRMTARFQGIVARHESEHKAERIARRRRQQAERGEWGGGVRPFGWERDGKTPIPAEVAAIRQAVDMLLHGGSLRGVVRMLNDIGLRTTKKGQLWESLTVTQMLLRPRNAGVATYKDTVVGRGVWEPVLSEDELRALKEILSRKDRRTSPGNVTRWLGSLLYVCGVCEETLYVGSTGSPGRPSYRCRAMRRGGRYHVSRQAVTLDWHVTELLLARLGDPAYAEAFAPEFTATVDLTVLRRRLAMLETQGRSMATRLGQELISEDEFDSFIVENRAKIRAVEAELGAATTTGPVSELVATEDIQGAWDEYDLDQKRAVLRAVMTVTVHPTGSRGGRFDPSCIDVEWL